MIKLWCSKVGSNLNLKTVEEEWPSAKEVELNKKSRIANNNEPKFYTYGLSGRTFFWFI